MKLDAGEDYRAFASNLDIAAGIEDVRKRIPTLMEMDIQFAADMEGPLCDDVPQDPLLEDAYAGKFGDCVLGRYGEEFTRVVRSRLGD